MASRPKLGFSPVQGIIDFILALKFSHPYFTILPFVQGRKKTSRQTVGPRFILVDPETIYHARETSFDPTRPPTIKQRKWARSPDPTSGLFHALRAGGMCRALLWGLSNSGDRSKWMGSPFNWLRIIEFYFNRSWFLRKTKHMSYSKTSSYTLLIICITHIISHVLNLKVRQTHVVLRFWYINGEVEIYFVWLESSIGGEFHTSHQREACERHIS